MTGLSRTRKRLLEAGQRSKEDSDRSAVPDVVRIPYAAVAAIYGRPRRKVKLFLPAKPSPGAGRKSVFVHAFGWKWPARRAKENSPAIHRWVRPTEKTSVPEGRQKASLQKRGFFRPFGTEDAGGALFPAINRWAILARPDGTLDLEPT